MFCLEDFTLVEWLLEREKNSFKEIRETGYRPAYVCDESRNTWVYQMEIPCIGYQQ